MPFQTSFSGQLGGIKGGVKSGVKDGVVYKSFSYGGKMPSQTGFSAQFGGIKGGIHAGMGGSGEDKKTIKTVYKTSHHNKDSEFGSGMGFGLGLGSGLGASVGDSSQQLLNSMLSFDHTKSSKGCTSKPKPPMNARLQCSSISTTCKASCVADYQFPNGQTNLFISCVDGEWVIKDSEWSEIPSCEPICLPACQNNGICIGPGQCTCPENYVGPQCQIKKEFCLQKPQLPSNSKLQCSSTSCTITCAKGYRFPDGTSATNLICKEGDWVPTRPELAVIPDCQGIVFIVKSIKKNVTCPDFSYMYSFMSQWWKLFIIQRLSMSTDF